MPAVFGALAVDRDAVDFGGDFSALRALPEQRVDRIDLGALRIASCERAGEAARLAVCPRTGAALLLKGVVDVAPAAAAGPGGIEGSRHAATVLARVLERGREAAVGLPGHYAAILWEP